MDTGSKGRRLCAGLIKTLKERSLKDAGLALTGYRENPAALSRDTAIGSYESKRPFSKCRQNRSNLARSGH
jgi:hypothetical protein